MFVGGLVLSLVARVVITSTDITAVIVVVFAGNKNRDNDVSTFTMVVCLKINTISVIKCL